MTDLTLTEARIEHKLALLAGDTTLSFVAWLRWNGLGINGERVQG